MKTTEKKGYAQHTHTYRKSNEFYYSFIDFRIKNNI